MHRRSFLTNLGLISGGLVGPSLMSASADETEQGQVVSKNTVLPSIGTIREPAREIPIVAEADVVVVGAGPAGVAAAISAAQAGASAILIERYNHLGGLWTGGMVLPLLAAYGADKNGKRIKVLGGIGWEIAERLFNMGMAIEENRPVADPEATKYVMEVMAKEAGVQVVYHCQGAGVVADNGVIRAVLLETKSGRVGVKPKVVVDCTGDGDVFAWAGEDFLKVNANIGLTHRLGSIDRINRNAPGFNKGARTGAPTPIESVGWRNMGGHPGDALNMFTLSKLQREYRIAIWENLQKIKETPGHEEVFIVDIASQLGVRASRFLSGQYQLKGKEVRNLVEQKDIIGIGGQSGGEKSFWRIPYLALVPKMTKNLLVGGRCISCDEKAGMGPPRLIGPCLTTGHGAGAAAAIAVQTGASVQNADIGKIQALLRQQKAYLG